MWRRNQRRGKKRRAKARKKKRAAASFEIEGDWFGRDRELRQKISEQEDNEDEESSEEEDEPSPEEVEPRKKKKRSKDRKKDDKKKKCRKEDRGPFGVGRRVAYENQASSAEEEDESSEDSSFQAGAPEKRSQQLVLMEYADRKPGRLASRLFQKKMAALAHRSGGPHDSRPGRSEQKDTTSGDALLPDGALPSKQGEDVAEGSKRDKDSGADPELHGKRLNRERGRPGVTKAQSPRIVSTRPVVDKGSIPRADPIGGSEPRRHRRTEDGDKGAGDERQDVQMASPKRERSPLPRRRERKRKMEGNNRRDKGKGGAPQGAEKTPPA